MTWPAATKNAALNGIDVTHATLHSSFPGATGANQLTGGGYTPQAVVINTAAGGTRLLNAPVAFPVPASVVRWIGLWSASTFVGAAPNGGATPRNFMSLASNDTVYAAGHGYSDGQKITFYAGTPPGGLTEGAIYFVRDASTDTFKVAGSLGGDVIDLTSAPSFGCVVCAIREDVYASAGTHTLNASSLTVPD